MMPTIKFNIERWKWSEEYDVYVSTEGRLRKKDGTDIKPKVNKKGYLVYHTKKVHRIVMETWRPCENMDKLTVDHINHNKRDHSLKNLEWVSKEENLHRGSADLELREIIIPDRAVYCIDGINFTEEQAIIALVPPGTTHPIKWFNTHIKKKLEIEPKRKICGRDVEVII